MALKHTTWRIRALVAATTAALFAVAGPAEAGPRGGPGYYGGHGYRGGYGYGYGGPGRFWGGLGVGIGLGALAGGAYYGAPYGRYYGGGPVYGGVPVYGGFAVAPPVVYYDAEPRPVPAAPAPPAPAEPVVYPSSGQSAERTEADRRECNRWATTQPNAMADAGVFHRATLACLEGRGYTVR